MKLKKQFLVLIFFIFNCLYSMESESQQQIFALEKLPNDILVLICEFLVEEKESDPNKAFTELDNFRISNKKIYYIIGTLVENFASKKFENIANQTKKQNAINKYTYLNFKQDYIVDLHGKKINNSLIDKSDIDKKIDKAVELEAYLWSKRESKNNKNYQDCLKKRLQKTCKKRLTEKEDKENVFSSELEQFLKLGVDPNSEFKFSQNQFISEENERILTIVFIHHTTSDVKLLLDYGADPNFLIPICPDYHRTLLEMAASRENLEDCRLLLQNGKIKADPNLVYLDRGEKRTVLAQLLLTNHVNKNHINFIKILLENGADPRIETTVMNEINGSILYLYKGCYRNSQKKALTLQLLNNKEEIPDIVDLLEDTVKKLNNNKQS